MMQLTCPHCQHSIEYSAQRPRFCSNCGGTLSTAGSTPPDDAQTREAPAPPPPERTQLFDPAAETLPPQRPLPDQFANSIPTQIAGYKIGKRLGGGGMGSVYEAEHSGSGQRVALKLIRPECLSPQAVQRFRLEGKLASTIAHPRCVFVLAADEEAGQPYIVMELMPGSTLTDLVLERGPLPAKEAIAKILDVIDGLQEAHRLGVIHRDVKPSNCFLDVDGRVKVGDFGLAKMQDDEGNLTRTGAFVGTVLFASPEQIKRQTLDQQADVYSVAATLYYLLTGKAPFSDVDALAATARIVSEDPPPMRKSKPDLPEALDRVVLRGLERDKSKRWQDLESLRVALRQFLPGQLTVGALGYRFGAFLIDWLILFIAQSIFGSLLFGAMPDSPDQIDSNITRSVLQHGLLGMAFWIAYFSLLEGLWGQSFGKWMFRLRVSELSGAARPSLPRALLRSLVFWLLIHLDTILSVIVCLVWIVSVQSDRHPNQGRVLLSLLLGGIQLIGLATRIALPLLTMRRRNGYRGPHEFASGTRVVQVPDKGYGPSFPGVQYTLPDCQTDRAPPSIGNYKIHGAIRWDEDEKMLVGDDPSLGRRVWIWLRPKTEPDLELTRRELSRATRMRWVACGEQDEWKWDAFLAPSGFPLVEAVRQIGPMPWSAAQPILRKLTNELAISYEEDTLPTPLVLGNVWVDEGGRLQLVGGVAIGTAASEPVVEDKSQRAGVQLIADVTAVCLEGKPRGPNDRGRIRAPIPRYASTVLSQFWSENKPFRDIEAVRNALQDIRDRPAHVTRPRRLVHVLVLTLLMFLPFFCIWSTLFFGPLTMVNVTRVVHEEQNKTLQNVSNIDLAVALASPNLVQRLEGIRVYQHDQATLAKLRDQAQADDDYFEARLRWSSTLVRRYFREQSRQMVSMRTRVYDRNIRESLDLESAYESSQLAPVASTGHAAATVSYLSLEFFSMWALIVIPMMWVFWGFISRGGVVLSFSGLELVRRDGRRASFLQCLFRGLLFWTPLSLVWGLSAWLEFHYWSNWSDPLMRDQTWSIWLSWLLWWIGAGLLGVYLALLLYRPDRAWYDRVVGTWIVPR